MCRAWHCTMQSAVSLHRKLHALEQQQSTGRSYWQPVERPWLKLYGNLLPLPVSSLWAWRNTTTSHQEAPLLQLPDELLLLILQKVQPFTLGKVAVVCRHFKELVDHPRLWELACREAFALTHPTPTHLKRLLLSYRNSWKRTFLEHPHLRFDGLYVSSNTYIRPGVAEFSSRNRPVHVVVYFRYYRFFPDGSLLYRTSPLNIAKVARSFRPGATTGPGVDVNTLASADVFAGRYMMKDNQIAAVVFYPNTRSTEIRVRMLLRSTHQGANNRIDLQSIVSYDKELGMATDLQQQPQPQDEQQQQQQPAQHQPVHQQHQQQQPQQGGAAGAGGHGQGGQQGQQAGLPDAADGDLPGGLTHKRGLKTCVFVSWHDVNSSPLNLPVKDMDLWLPN